METKFNFKSQVCTDRFQSERLLALGLKKETADMAYLWYGRAEDDTPMLMDKPSLVYQGIMTQHDIPAWSLARLWELLGKIKKYEGEDELSYPRISLVEEDVIVENPKSLWVRQSFISPKGVYENIINCLEELIKEGYFNKEYLCEK